MDHTINMSSIFIKFFISHAYFDTSLQDYELYR
jgi:hypothetical protein